MALLVATLLTTLPLLTRSDIRNAEYFELLEVKNVGEVKAGLIVKYLESDPSATIDDLENICGVGKKIVRELKREWY